MKSLYRSYFFWIVFITASILGFYFSYYLYSKAFTLLDINITMSRQEALSKAHELAEHLNIGPMNQGQAASFNSDDTTQTFVELEGGGKDAFVAMFENNLYQPYQWNVRHFKEFEIDEALFSFTPQGKPYGFSQTIPEAMPGAALSSTEALKIAKDQAMNNWDIDFTSYNLIDTSKEVQPGGRIDHTYVFERNERIADGFYQLILVVSGDKLTSLNHSVKVPEVFIRRYQEMRSANNTIATIAFIFTVLLYIIGGCFFGLFFLFRRNFVIWKPALLWALFLSILSFIDTFNELPLAWLNYSTSLNKMAFLIQFLSQACVAFFFGIPRGFIFFSIVFMAAESLTRYALKNQPQFWKSASPPVASSYGMVGRTLAGYLLVPLALMYLILFYIFTIRTLGWWMPANVLFDPNTLATYMPWFHSVSTSLIAGFMEECFFRAIPLAVTIIIAKKYSPSKRNTIMILGFLTQAVLFAAVHANYPAQPAYARLIELLGMSFVFGYLYLAFGLIPGIIAHYLYDVALFSLPLFASSAPGIMLNRLMVIGLSAIPIFVIIYAFIKQKGWHVLPPTYLNQSWQAPEHIIEANQPIIPPISITIPLTVRKNIVAAGVLGLCAWLINLSWHDDAKQIQISRKQAIQQAQKAFEETGIDLKDWYPMTDFFAHFNESPTSRLHHRFIWQEEGPDVYKKLLNNHLLAPHWQVRFGKFEGDISERARQYRAFVNDDGIIKKTMILPEDDAGANLTEPQARKLAHETLEKKFHMSPANTQEIAAISEKQPNRTDWVFTFVDPYNYPLKKGQARITISIGGDKVIDTNRFIYVPQDWARAEHNRSIIAQNISTFIGLFIYLLFIIGLIAAAYRLALRHRKVSIKNLIIIGVTLSSLYLFNLFLTWPQVVAKFSTSQPFFNQILNIYSISIVWAVLKSWFLALMIVFINSIWTRYCIRQTPSVFSAGISLGLLIAGIYKLFSAAVPALEPTWANYTMLDNYLPIAHGMIAYLAQYLYLTIFFLLWTIALNTLTDQWNKRQLLGSFGIFFLTFLIIGYQTNSNVSLWLTLSVVIGALLWLSYKTFVRFDIRIIPITTATFYTMALVQLGIYNPFDGARAIALTSIILIWVISVIWMRFLHKEVI